MKKTIENLTKAFIGESQARNRYSMYAKIAKKEGYEQLAAIFLETSEQEQEHAKQLFRMINILKKQENEEINSVIVEAEAPTTLGNTKDNLESSINGEHYEHSSMYPEFADIAEQEGLMDVATRLRAIAVAEKHHEERYKKFLSNIKDGSIFKKGEKKIWICRKCGYVHIGDTPPDICPSCSHPKNYFQIQCEEY